MKSNGPISSSTVKEELRISFTHQLLRIRDDPSINEHTFPATLSNIERKYIHKLADELGLKSKSSGLGESRQLTISKSKRVDVTSTEAQPNLRLQKDTRRVLVSLFGEGVEVTNTTSTLVVDVRAPTVAGKHFTSLSSDRKMLEQSYAVAQTNRIKRADFSSIQSKRSLLPSFSYGPAVCKLVLENQIILVSGETGCGKTTQVPQFLLDDPRIGPHCRMAVTQPRRISAVTVAERIAYERGESIGATIGYNIRLESEKNKTTQVLFVTPGVLLRKFQSDALLEEYSHVIIDEAHERDRFTEFLMIILRDVCMRRPSLKVILMSATLQTSKLCMYFGNVPHIHMGGSVFPVQEFFLEHALRFTDYFQGYQETSGGAGGMSSSVIAPSTYSQALALHQRTNQRFTCCICSSDTFKSAEELGTHLAMCTGVPVLGPSESHLSGKMSPRTTSSNSTRAKHTPLFSSTDQLVRELSRYVPQAATARTAATKALPQSAKVKEEVDDADGDSDDQGEAHNHGDDNDDSGSVSSDDDKEEDFAPKVCVDDAGTGGGAVEDSGDDMLLRQYQYNFDDTLVDYDLIIQLLRYIFSSEFGKSGSVLVFLPGWDDISQLFRMLSACGDFSNAHKYHIIQLHSGVSKKDQAQAFASVRSGEHKIILSTNIAETSITIDDIAVVIDTGKVKEKIYDPHVKLAYLKSSWISQASARQRKGRAGRTRAGVCFHLFSRRRHGTLPEFQDSELLRMPLEEIVLQAKQLGLAPGHGDAADGVQAFLQKALDPPHTLSVYNGVQLLQCIGCLDDREQVTALGQAVTKLPLDPRVGRFILLACLCGCGPSALSTAAAMGYRDPFIMPTNDQQRHACNMAKQRLTLGCPCDQIALLQAMTSFSTLPYRSQGSFCDDNYLSRSTMLYLHDLNRQLSSIMLESGFSIHNNLFMQRNNGNMQLLMALLSFALYPDMGVRKATQSLFVTEKGRKAKLHPGSVNGKSKAFKGACTSDIEAVAFQDLIMSVNTNNSPFRQDNIGGANLMMLNTCPVSMFCMALACGKIAVVECAKKPAVESSASVVISASKATVNEKKPKHAARRAAAAMLSASTAVTVTSSLTVEQGALLTSGDNEDEPDEEVTSSAAVEVVTVVDELVASKPAVMNPLDSVVLSLDGWVHLQTDRRTVQLVMNCRHTITAAITALVSSPAAPLSTLLAAQLEGVVNAMVLEQQACSLSTSSSSQSSSLSPQGDQSPRNNYSKPPSAFGSHKYNK